MSLIRADARRLPLADGSVKEEACCENTLEAVREIGPCPLCGEETIRNDRGGTTCVACVMGFALEKRQPFGGWR